MRVDCPNCAAAYEVPEVVLAVRRLMRCARCGAEFAPAAPSGPIEATRPPLAPASVEPFPVLPETAARPDDRMGLSVLPQAPPAAPRRAPILAAWALSLVVLGAGAWAAIAWRGPVMRAWPASARLYAALGYVR